MIRHVFKKNKNKYEIEKRNGKYECHMSWAYSNRASSDWIEDLSEINDETRLEILPSVHGRLVRLWK